MTRKGYCRSSREWKHFDPQDEGRSHWLKSTCTPVSHRDYFCKRVFPLWTVAPFCSTFAPLSEARLPNSNSVTTFGSSACPEQLRHKLCRMNGPPCSLPSSGPFQAGRLASLWSENPLSFWWESVWFGACATMAIRASLLSERHPFHWHHRQFASANKTTITTTTRSTRVSREWLAVGGCWALGGGCIG